MIGTGSGNESSKKLFSHYNKVKKRYLFFPEDIKKQLEIRNIF
jgi:hypothetical protein